MNLGKVIVIAFAVAVFAILGARGSGIAHAQSALPAPTNVQANNGPNSGEAILTWNAVAGANFYRVGWVAVDDVTRAFGDGTDPLDHYAYADVTATTYTITGLRPGEEYLFTVAGLEARFVESGALELVQLTLNTNGAACPICPTCPAAGTPPATQPLPTAPVGGDYDADDDGLIEIRNLVQLDAIRYDLDGDGAAKDDAGRAAYDAAFPGATQGMGCPSGCTGYELANDLDFGTDISGAGWLPIGKSYWNRFETTFDGNGRTVSNLFISRSGADFIGLFGYTGSGSVVKRVGLLNVNVIGNNSVGALVGYNRGGAISDSYATGNVIGSHRVGGLVGESGDQGTVSNSHASSMVSGSADVGGLVGNNSYGSAITDSYATGNATSDRSSVSGGLVGSNIDSAITYSHATGDVQGTGGPYSRAGGLVGRVVGNSAITASYATGNVSGGHTEAGGLVGGSSGGVIIASYATGSVDNTYDNGRDAYTGGLLGRSSGIVIGSYATGNVSGYGRVGGLIGASSGTVTAAYSIANVSLLPASVRAGYASSGGLVGLDNGGTVNASYWNLETSGLNASAAGVGRTTAQLQSPTGATGIYSTWNPAWWDFGTSSQYPVLKYGGLSVAAQR